MSNLSEAHYKELPPEETVNYLRAILSSMSIEVEEHWLKRSSISTFALRVVFKGTTIGANGKGVTEAYARASAYAELFERYQNNLFGYQADFPIKSFPFYHASDEQFISAMEIVSDNNSYIRKYFEQRNMASLSIEKKALAFQSLHRIDEQLYGVNGEYLCLPFYSFERDDVVYLPKNVYRLAYGSNGMSAGNTFPEAFVQGISEIFERFIQRRIIFEKLATPVIPDSALNDYPHLIAMLNVLRQNKKYQCELHDCSLGGNYPVVALFIIEKDTGNFGIKFGSHPDFGVAIERTFTEAAQGQDIYEYSHRSSFDFANKNVFNEVNTYNLYKMGLGQYPYEVLSSNSKFRFTPFPNISGKSNKELSLDALNKIRSLGYDVLIRDVSTLSFASIQIIVPGMSEMSAADDTKYKAYQTRNYIMYLLKDPALINEQDCMYLLATIQYFGASVLENNIESLYPWYDKKDFPFSNYNCGTLYLGAMAAYYCKSYNVCLRFLDRIISVYSRNEPMSNETKRLKMINLFCSGMEMLSEESLVFCEMAPLLSEDLLEWLKQTFSSRDKVISKQFPCFNKDIIGEAASIYEGIIEKLFKKQMSAPINQKQIPLYFDERGYNNESDEHRTAF